MSMRASTEAAKAAERHLRCKVLRTSPFWSKEGFSKETYNEQVRDSTLKAQAQVPGLSAGKDRRSRCIKVMHVLAVTLQIMADRQ